MILERPDRADIPVVGPHGRGPLPFLADRGVGLADQGAQTRQQGAAPVGQARDVGCDAFGWTSGHLAIGFGHHMLLRWTAPFSQPGARSSGTPFCRTGRRAHATALATRRNPVWGYAVQGARRPKNPHAAIAVPRRPAPAMSRREEYNHHIRSAKGRRSRNSASISIPLSPCSTPPVMGPALKERWDVDALLARPGDRGPGSGPPPQIASDQEG